MQKRILIFLSIIVTLTIGTVFLNFGAVQAAIKTITVQTLSAKSETKPITVQQKTDEQEKVANDELSTNQLLKSTDIIQKMKDLKKKVETKHLKAGWIHISSTQSIDNSKGLYQLPDGTALPNEYINEYYWHLDKDFIRFEGVQFMKSLDGKILQTGVLKDKKWKNDDVPPYEPSAPNLDWGASQYVEQILSGSDLGGKNVAISIQDTTLNGNAAQLFEIKSIYGTPVPIGNFDKPVTTFAFKFFFSLDGKLLQWQAVNVLADGSEVTSFNSYDYVIESGINPPSEILEYLK